MLHSGEIIVLESAPAHKQLLKGKIRPKHKELPVTKESEQNEKVRNFSKIICHTSKKEFRGDVKKSD